jgi:hypothetical protein
MHFSMVQQQEQNKYFNLSYQDKAFQLVSYHYNNLFTSSSATSKKRMQHYTLENLVDFQVLQRNHITNEATVILSNGQKTVYKTGGPYEVEDKSNIYVGDIWVMAGQSNMRGHGYLKSAFDPSNEPQVPLDHVLLFDSTEAWRVASDPTHNLHLSKRLVHHTLPDPTVKNPEICTFRGASLGPSFGAHYENGVPIGLIASAHGGVSLNDWERPTELNQETSNTTLYGAMMDRIHKIGNQITGLLWYQGESDTLVAKDAETYGRRLEQWIRDLRKDTQQPKLPIVIVQLGAHRVDVPDTIKNWMTVQDQQRQLFGIDKYTAGVTSRDCGLDDRLHLSKDGLDILGKRLAAAAVLAKEGKAKHATPLPKSATYEKVVHIPGLVEIHSIKLEFDLPTKEYKFSSFDSDVIGFELENSKVTVLRACIESGSQSIRLYLSGNPTGKTTVSYGMNQKEINLNIGQDSILPVFRDLLIT